MTGPEIREARRKAGFTQAELAAKLSTLTGREWHQHEISRYERGVHPHRAQPPLF